MQRKDLGQGCWYAEDKDWLTGPEADALMADLTRELTWEERPVIARGREILQPRLVGWAGALPYHYSGQTLPPRAATPALQAVWARVEETLAAELGDDRFNHAVVNRYRDGQDHMGLHADNEPELGRDPLIAAVSLGVTRRFVLEWKARRKRKRTLRLRHGSLLVMGGSLQHRWRHAVPRMGSVEGERINVTFRVLRGPPGWGTDEGPG